MPYLGRIKPGERLRFTTIARQQRIVRDVTALEISDEHFRRWKLNVALARSAAR
ncbi:MAG TPA: hypothetical protein VJ276_09790 [Thermoanaerobaculia bacterium]|nr:hypothetical protein [Thermoanaerobaculia bacterium]